jgi:CubicO group peptidase (beta-lactamase class C family)
VHGIIAALYLTIGAAQLPADSLERDRVSGALGAQLDSQLTRFGEYGFSGTVLVARDRRIVLLKDYGVSILQLAASGRLRLDDLVERYIGALPGKSGATIEHLATHTSGLVATNVMFFPQDSTSYPAFDPATGTETRS